VDAPLIAQIGLIDWAAFGAFIKDVGGYFVIAAIALVVSWRLIRLNEAQAKRAADMNEAQAKRASDAQERALAVQESLTKAIVVVTRTGEQLSAQADQHRERIDRLEGVIAALAQLVEVSNRKQGEYNEQLSAETRASFENAIAQMKGAGERIDARITKSEAVTGAAISGVQTTVTQSHAQQTEQLQMAFDELSKKVEVNGKATRDKLEPINEQLKEIRETLTTLSQNRVIDAQAVTALISKVDGLSESFAHLSEDFAAHATPPAPATPPVTPDPLAVTTKHATGTLPALPDDAPDAKRDAEAT